MLDQHFRDLMAGVCAPVAVVTTADQDGPHGATVSSLASLSLRPALLSIALDKRSSLLARVLEVGRFGVNVLNSAQDDIATRLRHPRRRSLRLRTLVDDRSATAARRCGGLGRLRVVADR